MTPAEERGRIIGEAIAKSAAFMAGDNYELHVALRAEMAKAWRVSPHPDIARQLDQVRGSKNIASATIVLYANNDRIAFVWVVPIAPDEPDDDAECWSQPRSPYLMQIHRRPQLRAV